MVDWTPSVLQCSPTQAQVWTLYTDGAWGHQGAGASAVLIAPSGLRSKYASRLEFQATNNIAEYEGLILGINKAKALGAKTILAKIDAKVVAEQVEKEYMARKPEWVKYLAPISDEDTPMMSNICSIFHGTQKLKYSFL